MTERNTFDISQRDYEEFRQNSQFRIEIFSQCRMWKNPCSDHFTFNIVNQQNFSEIRAIQRWGFGEVKSKLEENSEPIEKVMLSWADEQAPRGA
jgi:hypothetical protein